MKHISELSKQKPKKADVIQDILCEINSASRVLLGFKGGTSPGKEFAEDKCTFDVPG